MGIAADGPWPPSGSYRTEQDPRREDGRGQTRTRPTAWPTRLGASDGDSTPFRQRVREKRA